MTKEEIRDRLQAKSDITRQELYDMMDALGIKYRKTSCKKCLADYRAMVMEEVGLITSAADNSAWDGEAEYKYLKDRDYSWQGHRLNQDTPKWVIRRFMARHKRASEFFAPVPEAVQPEPEETPQIIEENNTQDNEQQ